MNVQLTNKELDTIIWALNTQHAKCKLQRVLIGKDKTETEQELSQLINKLYHRQTEEYNE